MVAENVMSKRGKKKRKKGKKEEPAFDRQENSNDAIMKSVIDSQG